jgi:hypothetical protein
LVAIEKNNMKKILSTHIKITVIAAIALLGLLFLTQQYLSYQKLPLLESLETAPVNGADSVPINWRYLFISYPVDGGRDLSAVLSVRVTPEFDHKVYFSNMEELYKIGITNDTRTDYSKEEVLKYITDKQLGQKLSGLVVERTGKQFDQSTTYAVIISYKQFNVFSFLLTKPKIITFKTNQDTTDEWTALRTSVFGAMDGGPSDAQIREAQDYYKNCPFTQKFVNDSVITEDFEIPHLTCDRETGNEIVTVKVKNPNLEAGKKAFQAWLKEQGFSESPKLQIKYTHQPK